MYLMMVYFLTNGAQQSPYFKSDHGYTFPRHIWLVISHLSMYQPIIISFLIERVVFF